jgi:hypothetical protein
VRSRFDTQDVIGATTFIAVDVYEPVGRKGHFDEFHAILFRAASNNVVKSPRESFRVADIAVKRRSDLGK